MSDLDALYAAILANPEDMTLWMVYADALDEDDAKAFGLYARDLRFWARGNDVETLRGLAFVTGTVELESGWREACKKGNLPWNSSVAS